MFNYAYIKNLVKKLYAFCSSLLDSSRLALHKISVYSHTRAVLLYEKEITISVIECLHAF